MLAPIKWLQQYTDITVLPEELDRRLTLTGSKVEGWEHQAAFSGVVTGRIVQLERHPDADRLQVCQIDVGRETMQIVTGADNVFEGAVIPVALPGAVVMAHGSEDTIAIKPTKMRGVQSNGMLCSGQELGIDDSVYVGASVDGIMILREEPALGQDVRALLGLDDVIIDFEITSNRPDCLSMIGLAREVAVTFGTPLRIPEITVRENPALGRVEDYVTIDVQDTELCPRYMARVIKNIKIAPSPRWMAERLQAAGIRPINNIVDITNYVMLEWGQPMHAFDLDKVRDHTIIVRKAQAGEAFATLDEKERQLSADMLVIADAQRPTGIAGVMGGAESEITETANTVLFECAVFHGTNIRRTARALAMRTESSYRFERSVDPIQTAIALERAAQLVVELGAGEVVPGVIDKCALALSPRTLDVSAATINALLGLELSGQDMADVLAQLGMDTAVQGDALHIKVPSFRQDIGGMADVAEEVLRIYGYDKIHSAVPASATMGSKGVYEQALDRTRQVLTAQGMHEALTHSFRNPAEMDAMGIPADDALRVMVPISNPLSEDQSVMRTLLTPSLLNCLATNQRQRVQGVQLFEISRVYLPQELPVREQPRENNRLALCGYGTALHNAQFDFYQLKSAIDAVLGAFDLRVKLRAEGPSWLHPGRKATLWTGKTRLGWLGELHPDVAAAFDLNGRIVAAELDFDVILSQTKRRHTVKPLPRFPYIERDMALLCDAAVRVGDLMDTIRQAGGVLLERVTMFDIYTGAQVPEGQKSVAFSLVFRAQDATLTDDVCKAAYDGILTQLTKRHGAALRM